MLLPLDSVEPARIPHFIEAFHAVSKSQRMSPHFYIYIKCYHFSPPSIRTKGLSERYRTFSLCPKYQDLESRAATSEFLVYIHILHNYIMIYGVISMGNFAVHSVANCAPKCVASFSLSILACFMGPTSGMPSASRKTRLINKMTP